MIMIMILIFYYFNLIWGNNRYINIINKIMPEGPDVWYFTQLINKHSKYKNNIVCHGKHIYDLSVLPYKNYSFGLTGKLKFESGNIVKNNTGYCYGNEVNTYVVGENLGISFMEMTLDDFNKIVSSWQKSKSMISSLLLNQNIISGIGIAWGSEILFRAKLMPNIKAYLGDLSLLAISMYNVQIYCKDEYIKYINKMDLTDYMIEKLINDFNYRIINMDVYKKGNQLKVSNRIWYT